MKRVLFPVLLLASIALAACTDEQRERALTVVQGASEVSQALASMPLPPGMENTAWAQQFTYWSKYAAGTSKALEKVVKDPKSPLPVSASQAGQ